MNYPERVSAAIEAFRSGVSEKQAMKQYRVHGAAFYGELNSLGIPHGNKAAKNLAARKPRVSHQEWIDSMGRQSFAKVIAQEVEKGIAKGLAKLMASH
jgi:hypothetical protein